MHHLDVPDKEPELTEPPQPWTPRDVGWGLVSAVLLVVLLLVLGQLIQSLDLAIDSSLVVVFGTAILLIPVWYFTAYKYGTSLADLGLRGFRPAAVGLGCGLMVLAFAFNMLYGTLLGFFDLQIQPDIDLLFEGSSLPWLMFFGGAVVAPVVEEIFFRGFVFAGLRQRWGWPKAMVGSAGLFAIAHVIPTAILPIFILGIIFAYLYQRFDSIWPAILMHMLTNTMALSVAYAVSQGLIEI